MSQVRPKGEKAGEIAAKAVVQLLFSTGKSFTVDGLREKLREFFRQEVRAKLRAVAALNNLELITVLISFNWQLAFVHAISFLWRVSSASKIASRSNCGAMELRQSFTSRTILSLSCRHPQ
jgi:hypothetical protein